MNEFRSVLFLSLGLLVGWSGARYAGLPQVSLGPSQAAAVKDVEQKIAPPLKTVGSQDDSAGADVFSQTCTTSAAPVDRVAQSAASVSGEDLSHSLKRLKMAELHRLCEEAESGMVKAKLPVRGIYELAAEQREEQIAEWSRRFSDLTAQDSFWKARFSMTVGNDVVTVDALMDLQTGTSERTKCTTWTLYYEINGRPTPYSYYSQSSCDGSGFRKKGDHYYFDVSAYTFRDLSKYFSMLLLPMPGGGAAEYLDAEAEHWRSLTQFAWQRSSFDEFRRSSQIFLNKVEEMGRQ